MKLTIICVKYLLIFTITYYNIYYNIIYIKSHIYVIYNLLVIIIFSLHPQSEYSVYKIIEVV